MSHVASFLTILVIVNCVNGQNEFLCPSTETSFHADFADCTRYWTCYRGVAFRQWCPMGLFFDRVNLVCGFPEQVDCTMCPLQGITTIKINCNNYRLCINGQEFNKTCPVGTWFDENVGECTLVPLQGPNPCPFEACRGVGNNVIFQRNPENCRQYFICVNGGIGSTRTCPQGTWFGNQTCVNTLPQGCNANGQPTPPPNGAIRFDAPTNSREAPKPRTPTNPRVAAKQKASLTMNCPREGNAIVAGEDCTRYAICNDGIVAEEKFCPEGLFFSGDLGVCSQPELANCAY